MIGLDGHQAECVDEADGAVDLLDFDDAAVPFWLEEQEVGVSVVREEPAVLAGSARARAVRAAEQRLGGLLCEERFADSVGAAEQVGVSEPVRGERRGQEQLGPLLSEDAAERQGRRLTLLRLPRLRRRRCTP
jgi:hypothetical protein